MDVLVVTSAQERALARRVDAHALYVYTINTYLRARAPRAVEARRWMRLGYAIALAYRDGRLSDREHDDLIARLP